MKATQAQRDDLCKLRCQKAGLGDTICLEICGEAGVDTDNQPTCGEIMEALGFEEPDYDPDADDEGGARV